VAVNRWLPLWLLFAFGGSFELNNLTRKHVPYELSIGERTMATGSVSFEDNDGPHELKLATIHVIACDVHRTFGPSWIVRELWLRSPEQDAQTAPDLELFLDFDQEGRTPAVDARQIGVLAQRELPILPLALGSRTPSQLRFAGAPAPLLISNGRLTIRQTMALEGQSAPSWHIDGDLDLALPDGNGATARRVHGTLSARLVWD
jgi:hypothetical protein